MLGGIISSNDQTSKTRIPLLGRLPIVGGLFSRTEDRTERTELILAITPTIIAQPSDARRPLSAFMQSAHGVRSALRANIDDLPHGSLYEIVPKPLTPMERAPIEDTEPSSRLAPRDRPQELMQDGAVEVVTVSLLLDPYAGLALAPDVRPFEYRSITQPTFHSTSPLGGSLVAAVWNGSERVDRWW